MAREPALASSLVMTALDLRDQAAAEPLALRDRRPCRPLDGLPSAIEFATFKMRGGNVRDEAADRDHEA